MEVRILQSENDIYQKDKLLGQGAFGKAYLVKQKKTGQSLVIKEVSIDHMSQKQREQTIKQAQILRNFRHPLIVKFVQVYATKQNKLKIVMEYAQCGDLSKAITARKATKKFFDENQVLDWFTQICLAMKHVHDRKILHRDIKGQNIFITKANTLKLGDFGIARVLNKTQDKARTVVGTPYYLSPQIIENKPYSFKSDVWSMGVLLYELCALAPPFNATSLQFLALKIVKGTYTQDLKKLVAQMLQLDPNKRPSVSDILKKPFLQDRIRKYLSETYRKDEFSHTVLHNQKFEIANKLVKVERQNHSREASGQRDPSQERRKLKEQQAELRQKMRLKREEEQRNNKIRRQEWNKKRVEEDVQRRYEQQKKRQEEAYHRRQRQARQKQLAKKRQIEEQKAWIERQKRREAQMRDAEMRRVQEIALNAKRREREEQQMLAHKQKLLQQKYELERQRSQYDQKARQRQAKEKQDLKREQFNELARKQWHQNQMIRKRAEERARQAEMDAYSNVFPEHEEPKVEVNRPASNQERRSREKQQKYNYDPPKKQSIPQHDPSEEELQNAMLNPNFGKRAPQSARSRQKDTQKTSANTSNASSNANSRVREEPKQTPKRNYDEERERMKKDREEFMRKKGGMGQMLGQKQPVQTLKPAKWGKSRQKSREAQNPLEKKVERPSPAKIPVESIMDEEELKMNIKDQEQFNDYLEELQDLIGGVNKNIQMMQDKKNPLPQMQVVEQKILVRQDDNEELLYSNTGSFLTLKDKDKEAIKDDADLDYFSSYDKLQELRIRLEDKFGTDNFIQIYRALEQQLQEKGLQGFNILDIVEKLTNIPNSNLIAQNLPLLLTLIVMQERMSSM